MNKTIVYSCDILKGINKGGTLKRDSDGWFLDIVLGALNSENSTGDIYSLETASKHFEDSSSLMRKVKKGVLFGEAGHPIFQRGMSRDDYINRLCQVDHSNTSHSIRNLRLQECTNPQTGVKYVAIIGDILPVREQGVYLEKELLTKDINVCFSIRTLTRDFPRSNLTYIKHITNFITIDWVNEGGIIHAQKYNSPSLEQYYEAANQPFIFTREEAEMALSKAVGCGLESSNEVAEVIKSFDFEIYEKNNKYVPASHW